MSYQLFLEAKKAIEEHVASEAWLDFEVLEYNRKEDGVLKIIAGSDLSYYHSLAIFLLEPQYFKGVLNWTSSPMGASVMDILNPEENAQVIRENFIEGFSQGVRFTNDDGISIVAMASNIVVSTDTVYYYWRDDLSEGERIADWVKKP